MKDNLILETIKKFPLEDIEQFVENLLDKKTCSERYSYW